MQTGRTKHKREKKRLKNEIESLKAMLHEERSQATYQGQPGGTESDSNFLAVAIADLRQKVIEIKADTEEQSQANLRALQATVDAICKNVTGTPYIRVQEQEPAQMASDAHKHTHSGTLETEKLGHRVRSFESRRSSGHTTVHTHTHHGASTASVPAHRQSTASQGEGCACQHGEHAEALQRENEQLRA